MSYITNIFMSTKKNKMPIKRGAFKDFYFNDEDLNFTDDFLKTFDSRIASYEYAALSNLRQALTERNELFASFAITKAEQTNNIRLSEAKLLYNEITKNPDFKLTPDTRGKIDTIISAHNSQEFIGIAKAFKWASIPGNITADTLSIDLLKKLHAMMTGELDQFEKIMTQAGKKFNSYRPGKLRNSNDIAVASYRPIPYVDIEDELHTAISFYKKKPSLQALGIFQLVLYGIHPFNNGNKRLCRVLEHGLMRDLGLNQNNSYNHINHYYRHWKTFGMALTQSLGTKNTMPIINFYREAIFFGQLSILEFGLLKARHGFINSKEPDKTKHPILALMAANKHMPLKKISMKAKDKGMSDRAFYYYLKQSIEKGILVKTQLPGHSNQQSYYALNYTAPEEDILKTLLNENKHHLLSVPESLKNMIAWSFDEPGNDKNACTQSALAASP